MSSALSSFPKALVLVVGMISAFGVVAGNGGAAGDGGRRPSNSFSQFVPPPPAASTVQLQAPGAGLATSKSVVLDPYKVPLIQNAGSLTSGR